ncbi:hypothetical protein PF005_g27787 [Phytophthora fragariae]|uniref:Uncharacterized protein n=1 Tax=Phytophthora fragariae TaxID=53985 RepID=A0A6A3HMV5_9STRA|nr:hypothetical protein PF011_g25916 [Phytophthora fragariae]KAE9070215.1 hypothetical protein PF006_g29401 [Phytophthora fragariae]KAE9169868.1 hypothetical protein PF005_g27787 [Phytophthora fragariae]
MLPTFSDDAYKLLVRLVFQYAQQNRRVEWSTVARKLHRFRINKTTKELETRLRTPKRAHGNDLSKSPPASSVLRAVPTVQAIPPQAVRDLSSWTTKLQYAFSAPSSVRLPRPMPNRKLVCYMRTLESFSHKR